MLHHEARKMLVEEYEHWPSSIKILSETFHAGVRRIYQLVHQKLSTGTADALTYRCGRKRKLSSEDITRIDKATQETPDITLAELIEKLHLPCSVPTLDRVVCDKLHYTRKKKMIHAAE